MNKIRTQKHTKETFYYALSRMFERASYYGLRALIVLYMVGETLKMERSEALIIYGWVIGSLVFSQIIGGLIGDLFIGNRKSIILGGVIQAIGAFSICIPSTTGLYAGLFLVVLGSGFYTPNLISSFGKIYLDKTKLLDSGFTLFYWVANLGAFLGILLIGFSGEKLGYNIGFIITGILMLLSIVPVLFSKETITNETNSHQGSIGKRILTISIAFIVIAIFWGIIEISNIRIFDLQTEFSEISAFNIPKHLWASIKAIYLLPIGIVAIVLWSFFYSSQFFKLLFGFIFGAISFGTLLLIPEVPTEQNAFIFLVSLLFLVISEIHIAPIINSVLTKYSNPKYLAIIISLAFMPTRLISLIFGLFNNRFYDNPNLGLKFGIIAMIIVGIGLLGYIVWNKKNYLQHRV